MSDNLQSKNGLCLSIDEDTPTATEFNHLRALVGWRLMTDDATQRALQNSLYCCSVRYHSQLIGFARVIGDGAMYYYVQDVMIHPQYQRQGIGYQLMQRVEQWLSSVQQSGGTVALLAAAGKEDFYQQFGYQPRPGVQMGAGMSKFTR